MIAFVFAAALLFDPTPRQTVAFKPPPPRAEMTRAGPTAPLLAGVAVTLECTARANGRVENCVVLGETHPGLGFGEAAIALMRDAEVAPGPRDFQFARTIQFMP
jgi:TonB family protein